MKVLLIGAEPHTAEIAVLGLRLRWPDARAVVATRGREGLSMVEEELPDVVMIEPGFSDMSLSEVIGDIRLFSEVPLMVLGNEESELEAVKALELGLESLICQTAGKDNYQNFPKGHIRQKR